jgi:hypothetical protein
MGPYGGEKARFGRFVGTGQFVDYRDGLDLNQNAKETRWVLFLVMGGVCQTFRTVRHFRAA